MNKTKRIVFAALMAALTTISTMVIHIPSGVSGYIHMGDGMVLLSGLLLGPLAGAAAGGIGSMLADLLSGYAFYAPATFVIKALAALSAGCLYKLLSKKQMSKLRIFPFLSAGMACSIIVTGGYFLFELAAYGASVAVPNISMNLVQNLSSLIVGGILLPVLLHVPEIRQLND